MTTTKAKLAAGGKVVRPETGTYGYHRAPPGTGARLELSQSPLPDEQNQVDARKLTRLDVVAHGWGIKRHPGEDEDHLATRIRRAAVNVPKTIRPVIPPIEWEPPNAYKLGDPWTSTYPTTSGDSGSRQ